MFCGACTLTHVLQLGAHRAAAVLLLLDGADFVPQLVELEFVLGRRLREPQRNVAYFYFAARWSWLQRAGVGCNVLDFAQAAACSMEARVCTGAWLHDLRALCGRPKA